MAETDKIRTDSGQTSAAKHYVAAIVRNRERQNVKSANRMVNQLAETGNGAPVIAEVCGTFAAGRCGILTRSR